MIIEDIIESIERMESQSNTVERKLFASTEYEEKFYKKHYPGVEVIRVPHTNRKDMNKNVRRN